MYKKGTILDSIITPRFLNFLNEEAEAERISNLPKVNRALSYGNQVSKQGSLVWKLNHYAILITDYLCNPQKNSYEIGITFLLCIWGICGLRESVPSHIAIAFKTRKLKPRLFDTIASLLVLSVSLSLQNTSRFGLDTTLLNVNFSNL